MEEEMRFSLLSEKAITISFKQEVSLQSQQRVMSLKHRLETENWNWQIEVVPSYCSVTVFVGPSFYQNHKSLINFFESYFSTRIIQEKDPLQFVKKAKEIPVVYDGEDLEFVADYTSLSVDEIIDLHAKAEYTVAMIGFLPGFPYLVGMDDRLFVPRRETPRLKVQRGSVGLAGLQTGIYPFESPGGWQIIGKTSTKLFDIEQLSFLKIGDKLRFVPV